MNPFSSLRHALLAACCLGATLASAQEVTTTTPMPIGGPQPGVEVQYRFTNPSDSRSLLEPAPPAGGAAATEEAPRRGVSSTDFLRERSAARAAAASGENGADPRREAFINDAIMGLTASSGPMAAIVGATIYTGITPGYQDSLPHIRRAQQSAGPNTLAWIGFQPFESHTRVFLQTSRAAGHTVQLSPDGRTLLVRLPATRITLSNFVRDIDATFFHRPVQHIRARRVGDAVEVRIELARAVRYETTSEGTSPTYLYLDFFD
jgi:hypothetical protein